MSKKVIIPIIVVVMIIIAGAGFWKWKDLKSTKISRENQSKQEQQAQSQQQVAEEKTNQNNSQKNVDISDWRTYRSEKYGFEVKYPNSWELKISNTKVDKNGDELFFFQKDAKNWFAVLPRGGFGHGIQEPNKITTDVFGGKNAKMLWYNYPFPLYTYIVNDIPKNWSSENIIDIKISNEDQNMIDDLKYMYDNFQFIE